MTRHINIHRVHRWLIWWCVLCLESIPLWHHQGQVQQVQHCRFILHLLPNTRKVNNNNATKRQRQSFHKLSVDLLRSQQQSSYFLLLWKNSSDCLRPLLKFPFSAEVLMKMINGAEFSLEWHSTYSTAKLFEHDRSFWKQLQKFRRLIFCMRNRWRRERVRRTPWQLCYSATLVNN